MATIEDIEQCLRDGLPHLYSPTYQPPELLWTATGNTPLQGAEAVQATIIRVIEALAPGPDVPSNARIRRLYELLAYRYLQGLTQKETAQRLGITSRHLRREQKEAVRLLARRLWEQRPVSALPSDSPLPNKIQLAETTRPDMPTAAWRSQVRQELASLQQNAPGSVADVVSTVQGAVKSGQALVSRHGVSLRLELTEQKLMATIHPALLREVLLTAIEKVVQAMPSGEITLRTERAGERVKITLTGYPTTAGTPPHSDFIQEALTAEGGSAGAYLDDESIVFVITLPVADKITVAIVEDNLDLVHFYRNYTARTRYQIVHVTETQRAFEALVNLAPEVIVMDILLPDIDGWELLAQLHAHPVTRAVPVIICSVVMREELALAYGAALYIQKPVRRQQFIQALDQVLNPGLIRASRVEANNPTIY